MQTSFENKNSCFAEKCLLRSCTGKLLSVSMILRKFISLAPMLVPSLENPEKFHSTTRKIDYYLFKTLVQRRLCDVELIFSLSHPKDRNKDLLTDRPSLEGVDPPLRWLGNHH